MKTVTFEGSVAEYQGQPVTPAITYSGSAEVFENLAEAKNSDSWPNDSDILKFVNNKVLTAAKASKYQEVTKDLKAAWEASPAKLRKDFIESAIAAGMTKEQAEGIAASMPKLNG